MNRYQFTAQFPFKEMFLSFFHCRVSQITRRLRQHHDQTALNYKPQATPVEQDRTGNYKPQATPVEQDRTGNYKPQATPVE